MMKAQDQIFRINRSDRIFNLYEVEDAFSSGIIEPGSTVHVANSKNSPFTPFKIETLISLYGEEFPFRRIPINCHNEEEERDFCSTSSSDENSDESFVERDVRERMDFVDETRNQYFDYVNRETDESNSVTSWTLHQNLRKIDVPLFNSRFENNNNDLMTGSAIEDALNELEAIARRNPAIIETFGDLKKTNRTVVVCRFCMFHPCDSKSLFTHLFSPHHRKRLMENEISKSSFSYWKRRFGVNPEEEEDEEEEEEDVQNMTFSDVDQNNFSDDESEITSENEEPGITVVEPQTSRIVETTKKKQKATKSKNVRIHRPPPNNPRVPLIDPPPPGVKVLSRSECIQKLDDLEIKRLEVSYEVASKLGKPVALKCSFCVRKSNPFFFANIHSASGHAVSARHRKKMRFGYPQSDFDYWNDFYEKCRIYDIFGPKLKNKCKKLRNIKTSNKYKPNEDFELKFAILQEKWNHVDEEFAKNKLCEEPVFCNVCFEAARQNIKLSSLYEIGQHVFQNETLHKERLTKKTFVHNFDYWNTIFWKIDQITKEQETPENEPRIPLLDKPLVGSEVMKEDQIDKCWDDLQRIREECKRKYTLVQEKGKNKITCYVCYQKDGYAIVSPNLLLNHICSLVHRDNMKKVGVIENDVRFWMELVLKEDSNIEKQAMFPIAFMYWNVKSKITHDEEKCAEKFEELRAKVKDVNMFEFNVRFRKLVKMHDLKTCLWCGTVLHTPADILQHVVSAEHEENVMKNCKIKMSDFDEWFDRTKILDELLLDKKLRANEPARLEAAKKFATDRTIEEAEKTNVTSHKQAFETTKEASNIVEPMVLKPPERHLRPEVLTRPVSGEKSYTQSVEPCRLPSYNDTTSTPPRIRCDLLPVKKLQVDERPRVETAKKVGIAKITEAERVFETSKIDMNSIGHIVSKPVQHCLRPEVRKSSVPGERSYTQSAKPCRLPLFRDSISTTRRVRCDGPSLAELQIMRIARIDRPSYFCIELAKVGCAACDIDLSHTGFYSVIDHAFSSAHLENMKNHGVVFFEEDFDYWAQYLCTVVKLNLYNFTTLADRSRRFNAHGMKNYPPMFTRNFSREGCIVSRWETWKDAEKAEKLVRDLDCRYYDAYFPDWKNIGCYFCCELLCSPSEIAKHAISESHFYWCHFNGRIVTDGELDYWVARMELFQNPGLFSCVIL